jgi:hypothetical protein
MLTNLGILIVLILIGGLNFIFASFNFLIPNGLSNSLTVMTTESLKWNDLIPVATILTCMILIMNFHIIIWLSNMISSIFAFVRGSGKVEL